MVEYFHGMECFLPGMREEDAVVISRVGGGGRAVDTSMGKGKLPPTRLKLKQRPCLRSIRLVEACYSV